MKINMVNKLVIEVPYYRQVELEKTITAMEGDYLDMLAESKHEQLMGTVDKHTSIMVKVLSSMLTEAKELYISTLN